MVALNRVQLVGFMGHQPQLTLSKTGRTFAFASLATNESFLKENQWNVSTEWHHLIFLGRLAKVTSASLKKGSLVFVEGKLRSHHWIDKDGIKQRSTSIVVKTIQLLDKAKSQEIPEINVSNEIGEEFLSQIKSMVELSDSGN